MTAETKPWDVLAVWYEPSGGFLMENELITFDGSIADFAMLKKEANEAALAEGLKKPKHWVLHVVGIGEAGTMFQMQEFVDQMIAAGKTVEAL